MTMIPIDSIAVPGWVRALCADWYENMDMLYAVTSTGGLTCGNRRPRGCYTPQQWYLSIWIDFSIDMGCAARAARKACMPEADELERAEEWIDSVCDDLRTSYDLEDWDGDD